MEETEEINKTNHNIKYDARKEQQEPKISVYDDINRNLQEIKEIFSVPKNNDFVIKQFTIKGDTKCFLIFYEGMIDTPTVNDFIIRSLMELPYEEKSEITHFAREIRDKFIIHAQVNMTDSFDMLTEEVNFGSVALFIDGLNQAFVLDVRKWEHRGITKPENEQSIYGPQEAFAEMLRTNTILIRKILKTEKLIAEAVKIGTISKTRGVLLYLDGVANEELINLVKARIQAISCDFVLSIEEVSHFIEDRSYIPTVQTLSTERPDRAARMLTEGRVVL